MPTTPTSSGSSGPTCSPRAPSRSRSSRRSSARSSSTGSTWAPARSTTPGPTRPRASRTTWEVNATNGVGQMNYEAYASLVEAGVIRATRRRASQSPRRDARAGTTSPPDERSDYAARAAARDAPLHARRVAGEHLPRPLRGLLRRPVRQRRLVSAPVRPTKLLARCRCSRSALTACGADNPPGTISEDDLPEQREGRRGQPRRPGRPGRLSRRQRRRGQPPDVALGELRQGPSGRCRLRAAAAATTRRSATRSGGSRTRQAVDGAGLGRDRQVHPGTSRTSTSGSTCRAIPMRVGYTEAG